MECRQKDGPLTWPDHYRGLMIEGSSSFQDTNGFESAFRLRAMRSRQWGGRASPVIYGIYILDSQHYSASVDYQDAVSSGISAPYISNPSLMPRNPIAAIVSDDNTIS